MSKLGTLPNTRPERGNPPVLEVVDLTVSFPIGPTDVNAVRGVSFATMPGEVLAIVGESGSGKSATALAIMGLLPKFANVTGSIRWKGQELLESTGQHKVRSVRGNRISLVPQDPMTSLNPVYTIGFQLGEAIRTHRRASRAEVRSRSIELLEALGIRNAANRLSAFPHELSGGLRQRVVIAMAMANNPDIIIADEATTALDVTVQAQVLDSLRKAQELSGAAILLITHDLGIVAGRADRMVVMKDGQVVETGSVEETFYRPSTPYTRALLDSMPKTPLELAREGSSTVSDTTVGVPLVTPGLLDASQPLLSMRAIKKYYPTYSRAIIRRQSGVFKAVDGIDLDLEQGKTVGIVGESGSGKTTLIRTIFDLEPITSGIIRFEGRNIAEMNTMERRGLRQRIQMVFQDPYASLDPMMTIYDSLMEPAIINKLDRNVAIHRVSELLTKVGLLPEHAARYPNEFSGGQRQRIAIARALMLNPSVIALDEPVSALDMTVQAEILDLLKQLQSEMGLSYLFISHDLSVIASMSDTVIVMHGGKVVERGPVSDIFRRPQDPYTKALLAAIPLPDPKLEKDRQRRRQSDGSAISLR